MTTVEVGRKLVELCNQNKHMEAMETLYAQNIVSIEVCDMPNMKARIEGYDAVHKKATWWFENHVVHGGKAEGPWPHGDRFIVKFWLDVTPKAGPMASQRFQMEEAALYTVKDGKIVQEEFFYDMGG